MNGGTLLVNNTAGSLHGAVTVNNAGTTLGGTGTISGAVTVNAGANIAPGNGGNTTAILTTGALTLAATSNFRVDINGTTAGSGYDQLRSWRQGELRLPEAILWSQSARHYRSGRHFHFEQSRRGRHYRHICGDPQGGTVVGSNGTVFSVSYTAGNGNDIVLTVVAAPVPNRAHG